MTNQTVVEDGTNFTRKAQDICTLTTISCKLMWRRQVSLST